MPFFLQTWLPYIYLYGVGGIFFLAGVLIVKRSGALDLRKKNHRYWLKVLIFGYIYFMIMHAVATIAALYW